MDIHHFGRICRDDFFGMRNLWDDMNREIKFRAWDDHNKVMISPYCELRDNRFWGEDLTNTGYANPTSVMQFTGLLDKNGVEIYEGDIVKCIDENLVVYFNSCTASFDVMYAWPDGDSEPFYPYEGDENEYEVIGNIHQNPELL